MEMSPSSFVGKTGSVAISCGVWMRESSGGHVARLANELSCSAGGDGIASSGVGMI
jgi:hypothetical protein